MRARTKGLPSSGPQSRNRDDAGAVSTGVGRAFARLLASAMFVVASVGCTASDGGSIATSNPAASVVAPGYVSGVCRPTPVTERTDVGPAGFPAYASPVRLVVGGDLAGRPLNQGKGYPTSMSPGNHWYLRDPQPRSSITLRAERLDGAAASTTLTAVGYPMGRGFPAEWAPADWYYRTAVEALETLPVEGCWRISLVGGSADDAVVYSLKAEIPPRAR